jgi:D-serine deaminase-like pyridoxal phosphate-dependent protein
MMNTPSTPFLLVDMPRVHRNIERLADFGRRHNIGLRPHTKTHKSLVMANLQLAAGAVGLTVAKVGEAEVMAQTGADLLIAYPLVDEGACERAASLSREYSLHVALDSVVAAERLANAAKRANATAGVLIDLNVGMNRTGVASPQAALELAQQIDALHGLRVDGLMCYPGHVWHKAGEQRLPLAEVAGMLAEAIDLFQANGLSTGIVSGGSTPSAYQSHLLPEVTEIRPGTYIYNDMNTFHGGFCALEECAASVVCTVVSDAVPGQVVIDGGSKTFTNDRCIPAPEAGFGYIVEYPHAKITVFSEEHGQVDVRDCDRAPRVGERVHIIPNHICPCVNLHDAMWLKQEDGAIQRALIDARGRVF